VTFPNGDNIWTMVGPLALENKIFFHKYLASKDHKFLVALV